MNTKKLLILKQCTKVALLQLVKFNCVSLSFEVNPVFCGISGTLIVLKQGSLVLPESPLVFFVNDVREKKFHAFFGADFLVSCIGPGFTDGEFFGEVACNVIPVLELFADARDSLACLNNSEKTVVDGFVCDVVHFASVYDLGQYASVIATVGLAEGAGEAGDVGIGVLKTVLKSVGKTVDNSIIRAASLTLKSNVGAFADYLGWVLKNLNDVDELKSLGKAWVVVLGQGDGAYKETIKMLNDFGLLKGKNVESLGRAVKGLGTENWAQIEKQGLYKYIGKSPQEQGDAILVAMKQSGEFTDDLIKQTLDLDSSGALKNMEFEKLLPDGKDADNFISVGGKNYWIDSTSIQDELISEQNLYSKLRSPDRSYKFQSLGEGGIQVIELDNGTKLTKDQIESTIGEVLQYMPGTSKIKVYDAVKGIVYWRP